MLKIAGQRNVVNRVNRVEDAVLHVGLIFVKLYGRLMIDCGNIIICIQHKFQPRSDECGGGHAVDFVIDGSVAVHIPKFVIQFLCPICQVRQRHAVHSNIAGIYVPASGD